METAYGERPTREICFFLLPCYKSDCFHLVCQHGKPQEEMKWFEGRPSLVDIPLPIPDPTHPWGGNCAKCTSGCHGHFLNVLSIFKRMAIKTVC